LKVIQAKSFLINYRDYIEECIIDIPTALKDYLIINNIEEITKFIIYDDTNLLNSQIKSTANYFEYTVAFLEAVLSLVNTNVFSRFDANHIFNGILPFTCPNNLSGIDEYFKFKVLRIQVPLRIKRTVSSLDTNFIFADPELFILETNIDNAHLEVIDALSDSIECFRNQLFRPSITMLGKAVEGAWIELGISLPYIC
jgi:hypothetical protein